MALPATGDPIGLTAEEILKQAQSRWFSPAEICVILTTHAILNILISERQERPKNGAFFAIYQQSLRHFRSDGHDWAKKKNGKAIQESHEKLKVDGVERLICLYAYGEKEINFQRRIYRMIIKEHGDIVIFHYRKIESQENRKIWRRGVEAIIVTPQSIQEAGKAIPTLVVTGFSSGIVDHSSNQLSLAPQTANSGNLNIQENVESAGCTSDIVDHSSNQLPLPPQTANTSNLNIQENVESAGCPSSVADHSSNQLPLPPQIASNLNIQENVESAGCSPDIVDHSSNQLPLPPQTATTSNLNIQENVESTDSQQDTDAEFSSSYNSNSFTEDDMLHHDSEIENQSIPQETNNDFLPNLAIPGSLSERMEYMESSSEKNNKNLKRGIEILGEHPANRFGEDHMSYQQKPELQKGWNNGKRCKMTKTSNLRNIQASAASGGCVPFEATENDLPPKPGIPVVPCELLELFPEFSFPEDSGNYIGDYPSGSIFESLLLPDECLISVMPFEWPEIDNSELFPEFSFPEDLGNYIGDYPSGSSLPLLDECFISNYPT